MGSGWNLANVVGAQAPAWPIIGGRRVEGAFTERVQDRDAGLVLQQMRDSIGEMASQRRNIRWDLCTRVPTPAASVGDDPVPM
jgi:hypothetical protein